MRRLQFFIGVFLISTFFSCCRTQVHPTRFWGAEKVIVKLDPTLDIPEKELPFDRNFIIRKYLPINEGIIAAADLALIVNQNTSILDYRFAWQNSGLDPAGNTLFKLISCTVKPMPGKSDFDPTHNGFDIFVPQLLGPNKTYDILITKSMKPARRSAVVEAFYSTFKNGHTVGINSQQLINDINAEKLSVGDRFQIAANEFQAFYDQRVKDRIVNTLAARGDTVQLRKDLIISLIDQLPVTIGGVQKEIFYDQQTIADVASTVGYKLETRAKSLLQPDFGLLYYGMGGQNLLGINKDLNGLTLYAGVNLLFRPFDPDVRLSQLPKGYINWRQKLSIHAGLTLTTLAKDKQRSNVFGSFNPLLGIGYRLSTSIKVVGGVILYNKLNNNPLYDDSKVQAIGYGGISIDLRVRELIGDVGKLFSAK